MYHVETMKFAETNPLSSEFRRQLNIKIKKECRHLKGIEYLTVYYGLNEGISVAYCKKCGKELSHDDIININKTLKKYESSK